MIPPATAHSERSHCFAVGAAQAGVRLDAFLAEGLSVSRAEARRLLAKGGVCIDGRAVSERAKGTRVREGSEVSVAAFTPPGERRPLPEPELELRVLAEGPGWLAVDKPAGRPVHPLAEDERGTLLNAAVAYRPALLGVGEGGLRSGVVHRLDVDTSGVLLLASDEATWLRLRRGFRQRAVDKRYRAIVLGDLRGEGRLDLELAVTRHRPARVSVAKAGAGTPTQLAWRALAPLRGATLLEVRPRTGFLHQIRVALAHRGHPVAGDPLYGPPAGGDLTGAARQMLHAASLHFEELAAESADPPDLAGLLRALGG